MTLEYKLPEYDLFWRTDKVKLRSIKTEIDIHPNARFKDEGIDPFLKVLSSNYFGHAEGRCIHKYNENKRLFEVVIKRINGLDKNKTEFVRGHEEAHAMAFLGQMTKLFEEAQKLGLSFNFFSQQNSEKSDESARRLMFYQGTEDDAKKAWEKEYILEESIANVGGLIALIKSKANPNLISRVIDGIKKMRKDPYLEPNCNQNLLSISQERFIRIEY